MQIQMTPEQLQRFAESEEGMIQFVDPERRKNVTRTKFPEGSEAQRRMRPMFGCRCPACMGGENH